MHVIDGIRLYVCNNNSSHKLVQGKICLTDDSFTFLDHDGRREIRILYSLISSVEKLATSQHGSGLRVRTKHFLTVEFLANKEQNLTELLQRINENKPGNYGQLNCFLYSPENHLEKKWTSYSLRAIFAAMNVPNNFWRIEEGNNDYSLCETYPSVFFVPNSVVKSVLLASAKFRSRARLPVLTYFHRNGASITRCAQPLAGLNTRSTEDELLLQCILKTNPNSSTMYIIDTRPRINAVANRAAGKGYENEVYYENMQFKFCPIENIHVMRSSLQKMIEVCETKNSTVSQFLAGLESSSWLQHIKAVIDAAVFIATAIEVEKKNVLVHCSDGWDRTAQCCSLASLLLSKNYRTIRGVQNLIEKEWLSFGHKFTDRCGHLGTSDSKEQAPIFLQFVETLWQLTEYYPTAFEYNERFLIVLYENSQSCRFGNFIGNCERERFQLKIEERTFSFWDFVSTRINDFRNPLFNDRSIYANEVLLPNFNIRNLKFWSNMYQRFDGSVLPRETISKKILTAADHNEVLEDHARFLTKRIEQIRSTLEQNEENVLFEHLKIETESIAIDWQNYYSTVQCSCVESIDSMQRKYNCWRCGKLFCVRCIDYRNNYPSLDSASLFAALCQTCSRWFKSNGKSKTNKSDVLESSFRRDD